MLAVPQCSCRAFVIKSHMISGWKAIPFYSLLSSLPHKHLNITILTADENLAQESIFKLPAGVAMPALPPPCHEPLLAFHHSVGLFCCLCTSSVLCCASVVRLMCIYFAEASAGYSVSIPDRGGASCTFLQSLREVPVALILLFFCQNILFVRKQENSASHGRIPP